MRVRASFFVCVVAVASVAAGGAWAHGGAIEDAVKALSNGPVYVDPDAEPTLSDTQAQALANRIRASGRSIYVAVIDPQDEEPHDVVHELVSGVGRPGTYVVVAGGEFGVHSTEFAHERSEELAADADGAPKGQLAATLRDLVTEIRETEVAAAATESKDDDAPWLWVVLALVALALVAGGLTAIALRRARRADVPEAPPPPA